MGKLYFPLPNAIDRTLAEGEKHVREDYMRIFISYCLRIALLNRRNCFQKKERKELSEIKLIIPRLGTPYSTVR